MMFGKDKMKNYSLQHGFSFIEILIVLGTIFVLTLGLMIIINFDRIGGTYRNFVRQSDIRQIQLAIKLYADDNQGNIPAGITTVSSAICQPGCFETPTQTDISDDILVYMNRDTLPIDPQQTGLILTGYNVYVTTSGTIVVSAPLSENSTTINTLQ